ncbi:MAG: nucleotidyltransferase [Burkholderiales bacterium]
MATRLEKLTARRTDPYITNAKLLNEAYRNLLQSESVRYVVGAMQPIDPEYTRNTYVESERVCNQLRNRLSTKCEYEYQGSVTNDTHIKARSDIDVLLLTDKFHTLEKPQVPSSPYKGDPLQDLLDLRAEAIASLESAFPEASIDTSGSKSITIEGGSLRRKIDVVPSNWYNTNKYAETGQKMYRGVQILDAQNKTRLKNTPFLHNAWIDYKDSKTNGGMRKAARLMKSLKYDAENIDLSSYDIVSLAFNISDDGLNHPRGMELSILNACHSFCVALQNDDQLRESLDVPDGHRKIFANGHATVVGLSRLTAALSGLINDVLTENQRSFKRLAEARVEY